VTVDAHNHLDRCPAPAALLDEAAVVGLDGMVIAGVSPAAALAQRALCAGRPGLAWTLGLHPEHAGAHGPAAAAEERAALTRAVQLRPAGIGEIGLDRRFSDPDRVGAQRAALALGLDLAQAHALPVVLHVVGAHAELLSALRGARWRGMVHAFGGSAEEAERYLNLGLHLSFGGALTWGPSKRRERALRAVPAERLLIETDAPDQIPAPWRGSTPAGRPAMWPAVAAAAAALRGEEPAALAAQVGANARSLFGLGVGLGLRPEGSPTPDPRPAAR
jgi:TatD DNase family protein